VYEGICRSATAGTCRKGPRTLSTILTLLHSAAISVRRQTRLLHVFEVVEAPDVFVAAVAERGDDGVAEAEFTRDTDRRCDVGAAGAAQEQALAVGSDTADADALGDRTRAVELKRAGTRGPLGRTE